ncbi:Transcriptional regulatory protein sin3 [Tulasnella sp. JGI-2019a]|nr:Transcriptional regulatory protein sin3 [Tulasnella sp. JGI-2019a]KAG8998720.1 Transcriptional regulatory protein sin3 [Tulasnella sp. JGI-2019a]KAG9027882.1 Transcriptional regulatory protein sin3 [Tulasnella sp. JGI-2019a]
MQRKVLVTRDIGEDAMTIIKNEAELDVIVWPEDRTADRSWILEHIAGCTGIVVMFSDKVDDELVTRAGPSLKVVSTMSVGYEHISLPAIAKYGIKLGYTPDVLTDAVADIAVMLALMASRNAARGLSVVQSGQWPATGWAPFGFCGPQLGLPGSTTKSFTVGFLGFGRISQATVRRLIPFGMTRVLYTDSGRGNDRSAEDAKLVRDYEAFGQLREVKRVDLNMLASESDLVVLLAPGGDSTYHIISTPFLKRMKRTSILVNPGRGSLVDSNALAEALNAGWLYAAGLDVVDGEPNVTSDHPLVKCPRATILPHVGSATTETRAAMASLAAQNLVEGVMGRPLKVEVNLG